MKRKAFNIALCAIIALLAWTCAPQADMYAKIVVTIIMFTIALFWLASGPNMCDMLKGVEVIHRSEVQASGLPMFNYPGEYECTRIVKPDPKKPYRSQFMTEEAFEEAHTEWLRWHFNR